MSEKIYIRPDEPSFFVRNADNEDDILDITANLINEFNTFYEDIFSNRKFKVSNTSFKNDTFVEEASLNETLDVDAEGLIGYIDMQKKMVGCLQEKFAFIWQQIIPDVFKKTTHANAGDIKGDFHMYIISMSRLALYQYMSSHLQTKHLVENKTDNIQFFYADNLEEKLYGLINTVLLSMQSQLEKVNDAEEQRLMNEIYG